MKNWVLIPIPQMTLPDLKHVIEGNCFSRKITHFPIVKQQYSLYVPVYLELIFYEKDSNTSSGKDNTLVKFYSYSLKRL